MKSNKKKNIKKRKKSAQKTKASVKKVNSSKKKSNKKKVSNAKKKNSQKNVSKKNSSNIKKDSSKNKPESKQIVASKDNVSDSKKDDAEKVEKDLNEPKKVKSKIQEIKNILKKENKNLKQNKDKIKDKKIKNKKDSKIKLKETGKPIKVDKKDNTKKSLSKKVQKRLILISIFCLIIFVILIFPFGSTNYKSEASGKILDVPKFSKLSEECCMYSASFTSLRSYFSLKSELENIISKYKKIDCSGNSYYYNETEDFTITEYGVNRGLIFNDFYITYSPGNYCEIDKTLKNIELLPDSYSIQDAKRDGNYVIEDGNVYNKSSYDEFLKNVDEKIPSTLRIAKLTEAGDLILIDVKYLENGKFKVTYDGTRDRLDSNDDRVMIAYLYDHIGVYNGKFYAYNGGAIAEFLLNTSTVYYLFDVEQ